MSLVQMNGFCPFSPAALTSSFQYFPLKNLCQAVSRFVSNTLRSPAPADSAPVMSEAEFKAGLSDRSLRQYNSWQVRHELVDEEEDYIVVPDLPSPSLFQRFAGFFRF